MTPNRPIAGPTEKPRTTLTEAFDALLAELQDRVSSGVRSRATLAMNELHVRYILERIPGDMPVDQVDAGVVAQLAATERGGRRIRADGKAKQLHPSTVKKRLSTLRRALVIQKRIGTIPRLPEFPEILTSYKPDTKYLRSYGEAISLWYALPVDRARWFWLALWTGQHNSDVERMVKEDMDPRGAGRWVRIRNTKNRRTDGFRIACPEALGRFFHDHWLKLKPGQPLVKPWKHVSSQLPDVAERLGLPRYTAKSLRHTFFTWMISRVGITKAVMEIGGWSTYEMVVKVYGHALQPQFRDAVRALDKFVEGPRLPARSSEKKVPPPVPARTDGGGTSDPATERTRTDGNIGEPKKTGKPVGAAGIEPATNGLRVHASPAPDDPPDLVSFGRSPPTETRPWEKIDRT